MRERSSRSSGTNSIGGRMRMEWKREGSTLWRCLRRGRGGDCRRIKRDLPINGLMVVLVVLPRKCL